METFKKAIQLFIAQKKWNILLAVFMCISITAIISLYLTSDGIKNYLENRAYHENGEFDGVFYNKPEENIDDYATYGLLGAEEIPETGDKISFGWMSEKMFDWGRINLLDGKFPQKENEVVVEAFYINQIDPDWRVGETRSFEIQGKSYHFILSGIIENYSYRWSSPYSDWEKGVNDFPNFIMSEHQHLSDASEFYAVQLKGSTLHRINKVYDVFSDAEMGFANERLYLGGLKDYKTITTITTVFQCIILLLTLISVFLAFSYYRANYHTKLGIYKSIGFSNKIIINLEIIQLVMVFLVSILLSSVFIYIMTNIFINYTFEYALFQFKWKQLLYLAVWLLIIFSIYMYVTLIEVKKLLRYSPRVLLTGISTNHQNIYTKKYTDHIKHIITQHFGSFIRYTLILSFCIISVFYALFLEKESMDFFKEEEEEEYAISHMGYGFVYKNNQVMLWEEFIPFYYERINNIKNNPNIEYVSGEPAMMDVTPLMPVERLTNNLIQYIQSYYPEDSETALIDLQREYSKAEDIPWNDISYKWVDKGEYEQLLNDYKVGKDVINNANRLMILLPRDGTLKIEDFEELDDIVLSRLTRQELKEIRLQEWLYQLDGVAYQQDDRMDEVTFILIGDQAAQNGISRGYDSIFVKLKNNLNHSDREAIRKEIIDTVSFVPGSSFIDLENYWDEDKKLIRYVGFVGTVNFWMMMLLTTLAIYFLIFGRFLANKQRWGVYLGNGLQKGKVVSLLCAELVASYFAAIVLSLVIFAVIMSGDTQFPIRYYFHDLLFGFSIVLLFLITLIICLYFKIKSLSIHSLLR